MHVTPTVSTTAGGKLTAVSTGAKWEHMVGYSRAVRRGHFIFVSGTCSVEQATGAIKHKGDAYGQAKAAFEIIGPALSALGATLDDIVRACGGLGGSVR